MYEVFLKVVNMSISTAWLVLAVLAVRLILKKAPRWIHVLLWAFVAVRLISPFSIESSLSVIPDWSIEAQDMISISEGEPKGQILDSVGNILVEKDMFGASEGYGQIIGSDGSMISEKPLKQSSDSADATMPDIFQLVPILWFLGMTLMLGYAFLSYLRLKQTVGASVVMQKGIRQSEYIDTPFVLGIFSPVVYLPYGMDENDIVHVVAHEMAHIRRKDHWWKPLGFLLLTIHWFNPLMWVAYILLCRDIELACDEKVIKELTSDQRADYTQALVACSVGRRMIAACPLAFGEVGVKERVKNVMKYEKPGFWIIVTAVALCLVVAVCFLTDPLDSMDHLRFIWSADPSAPGQLHYEVNLGNRAKSGKVYVEQWTNGTCVSSASLALTQAADDLFITICDRYDAGETVGTEIIVETNEYGGSLSTYFPYPDNYDGAYHYARHELNKRIRLSPDQEVILEARSFQCGDGIRPFTCETLLTNRELLESQDCLLLIRAVFSEDPFESAVSSPAAVLQGRLLDIQDGCFLVQPLDGSQELRIADRIEVPMRNMAPSPEPQIGDILQIEYDGMIQEVYPARITNVYRISVAEQGAGVTMVPTYTKLKGLGAGALLLPMDGQTYRYLLKDSNPEDVTADELLFTFQQIDMGERVQHEVYSLKEYPDRRKVLLISAKNGPWLCEYSPPQRCSDTALADAIEAGYVVMEDGIATHGQDIWHEFYEQTQKGKEASVTVAHYHTLNPDQCDSVFYQIFKQDYPCLYVHELRYDSKQFTLSNSVDGTMTYEYLMKYEDDPKYAFGSVVPQYRYQYVLTHDNRYTYNQLWMSIASSQAGAYIDHYTIYSEPKQ